jgi:hypothetical protein
MGAPSQGLKKPFALEKQKENVLRFKAAWELKCLFTNMCCNSCK